MDQETPQQRHNRELIELLNELRVALPGVQVLFAFLLAVPFSSGYGKITDFEKDAFFVSLVRDRRFLGPADRARRRSTVSVFAPTTRSGSSSTATGLRSRASSPLRLR